MQPAHWDNVANNSGESSARSGPGRKRGAVGSPSPGCSSRRFSENRSLVVALSRVAGAVHWLQLSENVTAVGQGRDVVSGEGLWVLVGQCGVNRFATPRAG